MSKRLASVGNPLKHSPHKRTLDRLCVRGELFELSHLSWARIARQEHIFRAEIYSINLISKIPLAFNNDAHVHWENKRVALFVFSQLDISIGAYKLICNFCVCIHRNNYVYIIYKRQPQQHKAILCLLMSQPSQAIISRIEKTRKDSIKKVISVKWILL